MKHCFPFSFKKELELQTRETLFSSLALSMVPLLDGYLDDQLLGDEEIGANLVNSNM
jgi:hypothetical protein